MRVFKIITRVVISLLSVLVIYYAFCMFFRNSDPRMPMFLNNYSIRRVVSGSMEPEIMTGEYVLFRFDDFDNIKIGDNIAYESQIITEDDGDKAIIIHKVIDIQLVDGERVGFITQGVNNDYEDEEVITRSMYLCKEIKHSTLNPNHIFLAVGLLDISLMILLDFLKKKSE